MSDTAQKPLPPDSADELWWFKPSDPSLARLALQVGLWAPHLSKWLDPGLEEPVGAGLVEPPKARR